MIRYSESIEGIRPEQLDRGFFVGWLNHPDSDTHLRVLQGSYKTWIALDDDKVVGFINAISDGVLAAFIPMLEVLPDYQGQGIGQELTKRMLDSLNHLYSIDLMCDEDVVPFYEKLGLRQSGGMGLRHYHNQSG